MAEPSVFGGFQKYFAFFAALHAAGALFPLSSYLAVTSSVLVFPVEYRVLDSLGDAASMETFERISHIFLGAVDSDPEASWSPCSCRMEKCAQSMLQFAVLLRCSRLEI